MFGYPGTLLSLLTTTAVRLFATFNSNSDFDFNSVSQTNKILLQDRITYTQHCHRGERREWLRLRDAAEEMSKSEVRYWKYKHVAFILLETSYSSHYIRMSVKWRIAYWSVYGVADKFRSTLEIVSLYLLQFSAKCKRQKSQILVM